MIQLNIPNYHKKLEFISAVMPSARAAIGDQHGWLIRWAMGKAGIECGWEAQNILVTECFNCLGIKAEDGNGNKFPGVRGMYLIANTGPERGKRVFWRMFDSLEDCFAEFVRMLNDRKPYEEFRRKSMNLFENLYTSNLEGHAVNVAKATADVTDILRNLAIVDDRGRF